MADIAVRGGRVADVQQPAGSVRRAGRPARRGRRRCGGTGPRRPRRREAPSRRCINSPKWRGQRRIGRRAAEHGTQRRVGPLTRYPRVEDQQWRRVSSAAPPRRVCAASGRCSAEPPSGRRRVPSVGGRRRRASRCSPHGTRASRALGETNNAARGEETTSTSNCQAVGRDQLRARACGRARIPLQAKRRRPVVIARSSASRRVSAPTGSGNAPVNSSSAAR